MKKLPVLFSLVGVLSLFFTSGVLAKPKKSAVLIENLTYVATGYDGLSFTANGTGTINCKRGGGLCDCWIARRDDELHPGLCNEDLLFGWRR